MPLKNYTTGVSSIKSIGQIQGNLVAHGASAIMINYGVDKEPESLSFIIPTLQGEISFRLPANIVSVQKVLQEQRVRKVVEKDQASRVAWRIIKDWVDAQIAIVETEMVTLEQAFLSYMLVQGGRQTLYESMVESHFLLSPKALQEGK